MKKAFWPESGWILAVSGCKFSYGSFLQGPEQGGVSSTSGDNASGVRATGTDEGNTFK